MPSWGVTGGYKCFTGVGRPGGLEGWLCLEQKGWNVWSSPLPVGQLWVRVRGQTGNKDAIMGVCYRPHHAMMMSMGSSGH